jgi:RHS repeat-associated protein
LKRSYRKWNKSNNVFKLPFVEEIQSGTGGRTTAQGYGGQDSIRQKFTSYEPDNETDLDFAQARMYVSKLGRFNSTDPLYIELRRLGDPQQINLYNYTRNNPLKFVDRTGLDIEVTGETTEDYINRLQKNVSFKINRNSQTGKVQIVDDKGNVLDKKALGKLGKGLKGAEKELFKAITDEKNHAVIDTVRESGDVDFGRFDGKGHNTIDSSDLSILDNSSDNAGFTAAHVVGHETLEAYHSAINQTTSANMNDSHNYANGFFAGITPVTDQSSATFTVNDGGTINNYSASSIPNSGVITHVSSVFNIQGTKTNIRIEKQFISPVPRNAIPVNVPPHHIVDVRREP